MNELEEYREAIGGDGPHAYDWADKPHRLVYDLINRCYAREQEISDLAEEVDQLRKQLNSEREDHSLTREELRAWKRDNY